MSSIEVDEPDWTAATAWPHPTRDWTLRSAGDWYRFVPESRELDRDPHDTRLPGLQASRDRGEVLRSWRVGRRAILRLPDGSWRKVTRRSKLSNLIASWRCGGRSRVATPKIQTIDETSVVLAHLAGRPFRQLPSNLRRDLLPELAQTLVAWHDTPCHDMPVWKPDRPETWIDTTGRCDPAFAEELRLVARRLPSLEPPRSASGLLHNDLHDKNVIYDGSRLALIDLDDLRRGPIEVDIANFAAHLTLRDLQDGQSLDDARQSATLFFDCVADLASFDRVGAQQLIHHTYFRLAALYHFRPAPKGLVPDLLTAATP